MIDPVTNSVSAGINLTLSRELFDALCNVAGKTIGTVDGQSEGFIAALVTKSLDSFIREALIKPWIQQYRAELEKAGVIVNGVVDQTKLATIVESNNWSIDISLQEEKEVVETITVTLPVEEVASDEEALSDCINNLNKEIPGSRMHKYYERLYHRLVEG